MGGQSRREKGRFCDRNKTPSPSSNSDVFRTVGHSVRQSLLTIAKIAYVAGTSLGWVLARAIRE